MRKNTAHMMMTNIQGIPCYVNVTLYSKVKGSYIADSDWDYSGYEEFEFEVFDRKGYPAAWLAKKITDRDERRIMEQYLDY